MQLKKGFIFMIFILDKAMYAHIFYKDEKIFYPLSVP